MAYAFNKITNLVSGDDQGSGSDIFAGNVPSNAPAETPIGAPVSKTTTAGDIGATGGPAGEIKESKQQDSGDQLSVIRPNVGKTEAPRALEGIQEQVRSNTADLQRRANEYTQNYKDRYQFDLENQALDQAISGQRDSDQYQAASDLFGKNLDPVQQFEGAEEYRVPDVGLLQTDAGLGYLAGRGRGPQYTRGMGALDVMLMKRDPRFQDLVRQISGESAALEGQIETRPDELEAAAKQYGTGQLESAQESARDYIGDYNQQLIARNEAEADAYEQAVRDLDREAIGQQQLADIGADVSESYMGPAGEYRGERYAQQIEDALAAYDPSQNIRYNEADYGYRDFLTEGEANELSNIGGLLGTGEAYTESLGPGEQYATDRQGMTRGLEEDIDRRRRKRDLEQEAARDLILREAGTRGRAADENLQALKDAAELERQATAQEIAEQYGEQWGEFGPEGGLSYDLSGADLDRVGYRSLQEANPDIYGRPEGYHTDLDMLTQEDVDALSAIQEDLGRDPTYEVGRGARLGPNVDRAALERYILAPYGQQQDAYEESKRQELESLAGQPTPGALNIPIGMPAATTTPAFARPYDTQVTAVDNIDSWSGVPGQFALPTSVGPIPEAASDTPIPYPEPPAWRYQEQTRQQMLPPTRFTNNPRHIQDNVTNRVPINETGLGLPVGPPVQEQPRAPIQQAYDPVADAIRQAQAQQWILGRGD